MFPQSPEQHITCNSFFTQVWHTERQVSKFPFLWDHIAIFRTWFLAVYSKSVGLSCSWNFNKWWRSHFLNSNITAAVLTFVLLSITFSVACPMAPKSIFCLVLPNLLHGILLTLKYIYFFNAEYTEHTYYVVPWSMTCGILHDGPRYKNKQKKEL